MGKHYFFSAAAPELASALVIWIGNLGVVPWLRSLAFLLAPICPRLLVRLLYVTRFFETMSCYLLLLLGTYNVQGKTPPVKSPPLILAPGEHGEISIEHRETFTVGNPKIISYRYGHRLKRLLLKGKAAGFTEVVIWNPKDTPPHRRVYPVYVLPPISSKDRASLLPIGQLLQSLGLSVEWVRTILVAQGTLEDEDSYRILKKLQEAHGPHLHLKGGLAPRLRNHIIGEVYYYLFQENIEEVQCHHQNFDILCHYPQSHPPGTQVAAYLKEHWGVTLMALEGGLARGNLVAEVKIIQMERLDGKQWGWGLDSLAGSFDGLFTGGVEAFIRKHQLFLQAQRVHVSTLAEPELILRPGKVVEISVGAEIPFKSGAGPEVTPQISTTQWKFAGLKVKLQAKRIGRGVFELDYQTQFTRPQHTSGASGAIGGSKEQSTVALALGRPLQLFQIGLQTTGKNTTGIPLIQDIPLLGHLFQSKSKQDNYKKITGIIVLRRYESPKYPRAKSISQSLSQSL